ncbi:hypothetical protein [Lysinibacillus sp. G4S2]|uniref:hypothetical protein n=1 Tax=Lysinibacillus sp. G4S2 TaxID=3055859 RepID=UPI0025A2B916|nr:hypothetical protein [Lysinibacillus sp. G4S2]MDM5249345.1 hypothetical protein [Lysinibacillus sp. G4S2]
MEQEVNQHTILQAILELSKQMQDMKLDLQQQIDAVGTRLDKVEQNLSKKIDVFDSKVGIVSLDLLETKAEVSVLQKAK